MSPRPVMILSNRGPVSFRSDNDGRLVASRGAGGLVSGLTPLATDKGATWIAAAMSPEDRAAAGAGIVDAEGLRTRLLPIDPEMYRMAYDVVCNATLWFLHHGLYDLARRPRFDARWREAWSAYRTMNALFARAAAEDAPEGAVVLVQDYHLSLVGPLLTGARPDCRVVHFSHTPFCGPDLVRVLPNDAAVELLEGLAGNHACGFHTGRWARQFSSACAEVIGREPPTFVAPLAADPGDLAAVASSPECIQADASLAAAVGDRNVLARVDRLELTKNLLRGFHAFDALLDAHPEWRGAVTFAASVYPSREGLADYLAYRQEVETLVARVNGRWAADGWTPILFDTSDDFVGSIAVLKRADVLLVNPIRDGMNLVAKEGTLVNERDAVLALSTEAGAWDELGEAGALRVDPFDVAGTADVLHDALSMGATERSSRAASLRAVAGARTPADWLADQLAAAG
jgi:trehalose 6-phosphate synthase